MIFWIGNPEALGAVPAEWWEVKMNWEHKHDVYIPLGTLGGGDLRARREGTFPHIIHPLSLAALFTECCLSSRHRARVLDPESARSVQAQRAVRELRNRRLTLQAGWVGRIWTRSFREMGEEGSRTDHLHCHPLQQALPSSFALSPLCSPLPR